MWCTVVWCAVLLCCVALWYAVVRCCVVWCGVVWCGVMCCFVLGRALTPSGALFCPFIFRFVNLSSPPAFPFSLSSRAVGPGSGSRPDAVLQREGGFVRVLRCAVLCCVLMFVWCGVFCFWGVASSAVVRWARRVSARAVVLSAVLRCNPNPPPSVLAAWCWVALCRVLLDSNPLCCLPTGSVRPSVRPSTVDASRP